MMADGFLVSEKKKALLLAKLIWLTARYALNKATHSSSPIGTLGSVFTRLYKRNSVLYPRKMRQVNGMFYWNLNVPGFPSKNFNRVLRDELNFLLNDRNGRLASLVFAITKKCGLNCEHCFEWDEINKKEILDDTKVESILYDVLNSSQPGQIIFSGGEPFLRFKLIHRLLKRFGNDNVDFWIISSGLGASSEKIRELKQAGLTGLIISLDHYDPRKHNLFRGHNSSFQHAVQAIEAANKANLVTALSLCPQKGLINEDFFGNYFELARNLKVSFVQFMEPRAEGRFSNKNVILDDREKRFLEEIFKRYNRKKPFKTYPIISYPDYHRRLLGCLGGKRLAYIDTDGIMNPCPFCKKSNHNCPMEV